jgi:hypothetical protein
MRTQLLRTVTGVAAAALLAGCDRAPTSTATPAVTPAVTPAASTPAPPPAAGTGTTGSDARGGTVAVYYLGTERGFQEGAGPVERIRLYREFHRLADGGVAGAVAEMLRGAAYDPDYRTGWPAGARVRQVRTDGDVTTVDLTGAAANNVGAEAAELAVQQLVWTVTAASGRTGVRLLLDGRPAGDLWGHVAAGGTLHRAPALDVLARVWLIDPQHGATVGRTFTAHVSGAVYESTVQLRVRQGERTVVQRHVTLTAAGEARTDLVLAPGGYIVEAYAESAVDGRELYLDGHTVTVGGN